MRRDAVLGFPASVRCHSWVTELPISSWRPGCIHSRRTGLIVLPSFSIISESIGSGKRDGSGEHTPSGVGMFRDSEFMRQVDEECQRIREAEREAARREELAE
jgi:hypothetical protein